MTGRRPRLARVILAALSAVSSIGNAQMPAGNSVSPIFTCTDAEGKRYTSDRPIPECMGREQRVLNADGSTKRVVPPTLSAAQRAEAEVREGEAAAGRLAKQDTIRRDRILMARYPNEAAHRRARIVALDVVRSSMGASEERIKTLNADRKPLLDEMQFYVGKPLPAKLKTRLDANDAALSAQRALVQDQQAELARIEGLYDTELARLKRLWAGESPGSLDFPRPRTPATVATPPTTSGRK